LSFQNVIWTLCRECHCKVCVPHTLVFISMASILTKVYEMGQRHPIMQTNMVSSVSRWGITSNVSK